MAAERAKRLDRVIELLLVASLAFAPLALGAVQAWSEWVVQSLAAAIAICLALKLVIHRGAAFVWSPIYAPVIAGIALVVVQLLELPPSVAGLVSPETVTLKQRLGSIAMPGGDAARGITLTFYPEATWHDLRLMLAVAAVFVAVVNVVRTREQVERLLLAIVMIGGAVAAVGLAHLAVGAERIYGSIGERSRWTLAPFLNRNHFGQFLNLCIGAGVGLLLIRMQHLLGLRWRRELDGRAMPGRLPVTFWIIVGALTLAGIGVLLSLSRGATASMAVAGVVSILVARWIGMRRRVWVLAPIVFGVAIVAIALAADLISDRFVDVVDAESHSTAGRARMVGDILRGWTRFPLAGVGMGAFETFYPTLDSSNWPSRATHAENEYAQLLLEGGLIGLGCAALFIGLLLLSYLRCIRSDSRATGSAAVGIGFGLIAALLHSTVDFGQHAPANAILLATLAGLLVGLARADGPGSPASAATALGRWIGLAVVVTIGAALVVAGGRRALAERDWNRARFLDRNLRRLDWRASDSQFVSLLQSAMRASERCPGNVQYQYWLGYWRWRLISRDRDPRTGEILLAPEQIGWAQRLAREMRHATQHCPTYGPLYLLAGQIELHALGSAEGSTLIQTAHELSRNDPQAAFEAGTLDLAEQRWDAASVRFARATDLDPSLRREAAEAMARASGRAAPALKLAGDDLRAMRAVVTALDARGNPDETAAARLAVAQLVRSRSADPDAPAGFIIEAARMEVDRGDFDAAAAFFRRALGRDPLDGTLRLELARALRRAGKLGDALDEAGIALRLGAPGADTLILELRTAANVAPATATSGPP